MILFHDFIFKTAYHGVLPTILLTPSSHSFLQRMGLKSPPAADFTNFLRQSCQDSVTKDYSVWAYTQAQALQMRLAKEPKVGVRDVSESKPEWQCGGNNGGFSFFPNKKAGNARPPRR
jgi:hypothetical protein